MGNDDDFYEKFQCDSSIWHQVHLSLLYSDGGNIFLGVSRVFSFILIFGLNWYNRRLLRDKAQENVNVVPGLVLPYYFMYIYLYIFLSFLAGILDIATKGVPDQQSSYNWIIPIEQGLFHWLYEGLAFFLMRYGAGVKAIQKSLVYSGLWGVVTFLFYFFIYSSSDGSYHQERDKNRSFDLFLAYQAILLAFYALFLILPADLVYRRPALEFYSKFNCVLYMTSLIIGSLVYNNDYDVVCAGSVIIFIEVAFLQPLALFRTFQIDSQYWQGLTPGKGNPLAEVWDHVDIRTAETMAEKLESFHSESSNKLPILHFGLLDFDENAHFVAGGFSRVYFGKCRNEKVAFKILFAMELTPNDVSDFYREASLLASLKHENIVDCKGICVMPPALTMVLEHCMYGSLYDFLYKPVKENRKDSIISNASNAIGDISSKIVNFFTETILPTSSIVSMRESWINPFRRSSINNNNKPTTATNNIPMQQPDGNHNDDGLIGEDSTSASNNNSLTHNPLVGPLDISKTGPSNTAGNRTSLPLRHSAGGNSHSSGRNSQSQNQSIIELDQLPRPSKSTFDIDDNNNTAGGANSSGNSNGGGGERGSFIQRAVDRISGMFAGGGGGVGTLSMSAGTERDSIDLSIAHSVGFPTRMKMMRDAIAGITYMHSKGFMHCDIKSLNFLVDEVSNPNQ